MGEQRNLVLSPGSVGSATLVAGTVVVALASVKANTIILLTPQNVSGTAGTLSYAITAGVGFTINSSNVLDTRTVTYLVTVPIAPPYVFSPLDLAGLKVWLGADFGAYTDAGVTLATNGQAVQQWNDQSGQGNHLIQLTAGMRPLYTTGVVNSKPIIRFDGVDDFIGVIYGGLLAQPNTIFVVFNITAGTDQTVYDGNSGAYLNRNALFFDNTPGKIALFAGTVVDFNSVAVPTGFHNYSAYFNGAGSELFKDGSSQGIADVGSDSAGGLIAGANAAGVGGMTGDIAEILVYNALLNVADRQKVEAYLRTKYATP